MSSKDQLVHTIKELLQKDFVETQEDIRHALNLKGLAANQAMISRILRKLGAIKMQEGERVTYRLPIEFNSIIPQHSLSQLILQIIHNETMIVISTTPGSAQLVARMLDQRKQLGILGTVAGDDTIFIAPESIKEVKSIYQKITKLLLG